MARFVSKKSRAKELSSLILNSDIESFTLQREFEKTYFSGYGEIADEPKKPTGYKTLTIRFKDKE